MEIEDLKKVDWVDVVNRKESLLFYSLTIRAYTAMDKVVGIPFSFKNAIFKGTGEIIHSKKELDGLLALFKSNGTDFLYSFRDNLISQVGKFYEFASSISEIDYSKLSQKQLVEYINRYYELGVASHCFLIPLAIVDRILLKELMDLLPGKDEKKKLDEVSILTQSEKENEHTLEERSFLSLAKAHKDKNKDFNRLLEEHLKNFSWIGTRGYWWNREWKREDIIERIDNLFKQGKNPEEETALLDEVKKSSAEERIKLVEDLKMSDAANHLATITQDFSYVRTWRTDIMYRSGYKAKNLFYEIAKRAGFDTESVIYLTFPELIEIAENLKAGISNDELNRRKSFFAFVLNGESYTLLSGSKSMADLMNITKEPERVSTLSGNIAFRGVVSGKAKVVYTGDDIKKVERGDILVAVMTFPNFIPAMEKAAAFVTDEGGILCHAAIVAREMKKPCITNTKIATKIFKDGDMVEVDAEKGIVKKIN
ncbi:MAG: PEP-utilizing enzyme [Candidatus Paceibacterota bacterium]|jgi:phosphohistidine swiveling domain-containing protein